MANIDLTDADNNKTVTAHKDDTVTIALKTNPSTGFSWQALDSTAGPLISMQQDPHDGTPVGSPTVVRFTFKIDQMGVLVLNYARPWAGLQPPSKWFVVSVALIA